MNPQPDSSSGNGAFWGSISLVLAALAWLVVVITWGWVLTRPDGTFHDMGALRLTFIVLPLTIGAWVVGGPIAMALGGRALKNPSQSEADKDDCRLARIGLLLGRLLFWAGVIWLGFTVVASFFR